MRSPTSGAGRDGGSHRLLVDGRPVADCEVADSPWRRLIGLLGRRRVPGAMLFPRCTSVHGMGMVISLDVALLADAPSGPAGHKADDPGELTVLRVVRMRPMGLVIPRRGVRHVLEAQAGAFAAWGLAPGSRISVEGSTARPGDQTDVGVPR